MHTILFDGPERRHLLPFTYTRPVADIRIGIMTLRQKWEKALGVKTSTKTQAYLAKKWPLHEEEENLYLNPAYLPTEELIEQITKLDSRQGLIIQNEVIAYRARKNENREPENLVDLSVNSEDILHLQHPYDIFAHNAEALARDYDMITKGRTTEEIPESVFAQYRENIFIEEGATLTNASLNAEDGPIYIGKEAEVMEGCHIRGPFAMGAHAVLKMGAKIYGGTSFGPYSKVGGEVSNSVIFGYSNKGHDGFLGNSVLGEWCNIGADSNNSNLKNNYAEVKLWDYDAKRFLKTGLQFCGLMMGDHSKCGINTMFNTGTIVGVSANIYGAGFPRNFIPSFSWGGPQKMMTYKLNKVFEVAEVVMKRRDINLTEADKTILQHIFDESKTFRRY